MSDQKEKQPNSSDDLSDIKNLIGDADGGGFTLDDILTEYGFDPHPPQEPLGGCDPGPDLPWPEAPRRPHHPDNVVAFPGAEADGDSLAEEEEDAETDEEPEEDACEDEMSRESDGDKVIEFPEEESPLTSFIKDLKGRADRYADQMFEEDEKMDPDEVRRLENLIPGTDREDEAEEEEEEERVRRPKRVEPPPPDLPPQELAKTYSRGLKGLRVRGMLVFLLAVACLLPMLAPSFGLVFLPPLDDYGLQIALSGGLLLLGMLLGADVLARAAGRALRMKFGMDFMVLLAGLFTLGDTAMLAVNQNRGSELPYCAVVLFSLWLTMHGEYHKRCGLRLSCRTAAAAAEPYLVTLDERKWNGKDTYTKWSGVPTGFGSQIQMDDGAQRIYRRVCPLLALGCVLFSLLASVGKEHPENLLWCLSASFTAAAAFGGTLAYGRPFHMIARRLNQSGAALAGWPGMAASRRGNRVLLTDWDLFPPGYVELNGIKVFGDFPVERVVAYTATLIRASGSGLDKLFHDLLRTQGAIYRKEERLVCYEGGGLSAIIRGDQVMVGSAAFMNLMEITLPQGLNVKNAVFCAINGELAAIFALNYTLPDTVFPALSSLLGEKVAPVLATRDFNVIPAMLQQRFKLAADRMDFPPIQRRQELSAEDQPHSDTLTAVLCREGLGPFADAVVGARRLRRASRAGAIVCCMGSALGILLSCYLTSVGAFTSLSALNLLVYMISWLLPVWFLNNWAPRY